MFLLSVQTTAGGVLGETVRSPGRIALHINISER